MQTLYDTLNWCTAVAVTAKSLFEEIKDPEGNSYLNIQADSHEYLTTLIDQLE